MNLISRLAAANHNVNAAQRAVVAIAVPLVVYFVAHWAISEFVCEPWDDGPHDLDVTWWAWALATGIVGVFEFFWLRTPTSDGGDKRE